MSDENESEDGFTLQLTRRRALGALLTIGAGSAAAGAGTFALFSDTEESTGNSITAGTLDLGETSGESFTISNIRPTQTTDTKSISSTYDGSIDANLDVWFDISEPTNDGEETGEGEFENDMTAGQFASVLDVDTAEVTINPETGDANTVGLASNGDTLSDLVSNHGSSDYTDEVTTVTDGDEVQVKLEFTMQDVGNNYQNDGVSITVNFGAEQTDA